MYDGKKIFILHIDESLMPDSSSIVYPRYNNDFCVEQDFYNYINNNCEITEVPEVADYHYLPVFWTRSYYNNINGFNKTVDLNKYFNNLQNNIQKTVIDENKTFTICQMEDGPIIDLGKIKVFSPAKRVEDYIDIPFIRNTLKKPFFTKRKKYKASFVGRTYSHSLRKEMLKKLDRVGGFFIKDMTFNLKKDKKFYRDIILSSYIVLCPRSYGSNTFRFYEAMELGVVPFLIGDIDARPFKNFIDWDSCSFFETTVGSALDKINSLDNASLVEMGKNAHKVWKNSLREGKWCEFVFSELDSGSLDSGSLGSESHI